MRFPKNKIFGILFFSIFIFLDQLLKYIIRSKSGFYICNQNLAFGLPPLKIFIGLFVLVFSFFVFNFKFKIINLKSISNLKCKILNWDKITVLSIILIVSGGISNIIDRINLGCVIDFIHLPFWPVFNFADIYITIGIILLIKKYILKK